jgi:HlyD family secretion protein
MTENRLSLATVVLIASTILSACGALQTEAGVELSASGIVEAKEVAVASEVGGRVVEVFAEKGDPVAEGDLLFRLEEELLQAERKRVVAAGISAIAAAELQLLTAQDTLDDLLEDWPVMAAQAQLDLALAHDQLDDAERRWTNQQEGNRASEVTVKAARAALTVAEDAMDKAKERYDRASGSRTEDPWKASSYQAYATAKQRYDAALRSYNWYTGHPDEIDQALLDAEVATAQAQVEEAQQEWEKWKDGADRDEVALAEANVANAAAQLALARANAEVELETIDLQLQKFSVLAPVDGTVLSRSIEAGEVVLPGVPGMTLGQLDTLTITVYVPEDRYGAISLGDEALVSVDSFPGQQFPAKVVNIADEAEFTPRNVQTEEERRTTVFAVELAVRDLEGRLKPGMPADVVFTVD